MKFDAYAFGEICLWVIPLVLFVSILITVTIAVFADRYSIGMRIAVMFHYIFCLGIILHEVTHRLMCGLFGVQVKETRYFFLEHKRMGKVESLRVGGYVKSEELDSIITGLFIGFAPLLINGLLFALIFYYGPMLMVASYFPFIIYISISLALGASPSKTDLTIWYKVLKRYPGRGFIELLFLCIFGGMLYMLIAIWQVEIWVTFSIIVSFIVIIVLKSRARASALRSRYTPRV